MVNIFIFAKEQCAVFINTSPVCLRQNCSNPWADLREQGKLPLHTQKKSDIFKIYLWKQADTFLKAPGILL